jgi:hypothetical protein
MHVLFSDPCIYHISYIDTIQEAFYYGTYQAVKPPPPDALEDADLYIISAIQLRALRCMPIVQTFTGNTSSLIGAHLTITNINYLYNWDEVNHYCP